MPWATTEQVTAMTGEVVNAVDLAMASAMIDTKAGTSEELPADAIGAKDRGHLRKATIWQAVFVKGKPGMLTQREAVKQTSAAGSSQSRQSVSAVMYAPLALLELENLSWIGTRTEVIDPRRLAFDQASFLNEQSDVYGVWTPVP